MGVNVARQLIARAKQEREELGLPDPSMNESHFLILEKLTDGEGMPSIKDFIAVRHHSQSHVHSDVSPDNIIIPRESLSPELIAQPPLNAEFLLHLLLRHDEHDAIIGDMIERYGKKCARLGTSRANFWFYAEVFWTALPLIKRALLKVSGMMTLAEFVRRHIP